ncbi:hypothetical protein GOODEAATRI_003017 [Goodea atripinnis]|uniref:Kazal-like domain-containing protein n=1 Tax=Goodea atripinnis TaxID=208336 RepID=A0ABV0PUX1_9TELE
MPYYQECNYVLGGDKGHLCSSILGGSEEKVAVAKAKNFLESNTYSADDPYTTALSAYALSLLRSPYALLALRRLNHMAITRALHALSEYAILSYVGGVNLTISLASTNLDFQEAFELNRDNKKLLQRAKAFLSALKPSSSSSTSKHSASRSRSRADNRSELSRKRRAPIDDDDPAAHQDQLNFHISLDVCASLPDCHSHSSSFVQASQCNNVLGCLEEERIERCTCYRDCGYDGEPICGSDGQLYQNQCQMEVSSCRNGTRIKQVPLFQCSQSKYSNLNLLIVP